MNVDAVERETYVNPQVPQMNTYTCVAYTVPDFTYIDIQIYLSTIFYMYPDTVDSSMRHLPGSVM